MKAMKIAGGLAAAFPIVLLSTFANAADQTKMNEVAAHIELHAKALVCDIQPVYGDDGSKIGDTINWTASDLATVYHAPIWQYKGQVGVLGCTVHDSLAKQLYTPFDSSEPPVSKKGKGVAQASSKGASNDLYDGKYESAVKHICTFIDVIDNNARLNSVDDFGGPTAADLAMEQIKAADQQTGWLKDLGETRTCGEILGTTY